MSASLVEKKRKMITTACEETWTGKRERGWVGWGGDVQRGAAMMSSAALGG